MLSAGETISHYQILTPIGKGGMGEVYLAQDQVLDRKVALKLLPETAQQDADSRKRFLCEAKAAAALDHPFVCRVFETGESSGKTFIVMEYVPGETLRSRMARGPLTLRETLQLAAEVAEALEEAHSKRIVHRDLKPANIMVTPQGHAKVMDFGVAKQVAPVDATESAVRQKTTGLTQTGMIVGTLAYMSPEQARGDPLDPRSDIFSYGVVFYEMLSGTHPFARPSQAETLTAILKDPPPELNIAATATLPKLRAILHRALAKDVSDRYQNFKDVALDLAALKEEELSRKRSAVTARALAAAALLVLVLFAVTLWFAYRGPTSPPAARASVSVLIADFQNRTGDNVFDGTLESRFAEALEAASFITAQDRSKGRETAKQLQPGATNLDESLAQLVAKREGINAVVGGDIDRRGTGYRVSIRVIDAATGRQVTARAGEAANKPGVLALVSELAAPVRKALGETTAESAGLAASETFTAGSLDAAHDYALAQECQWAGKEEESIRYYELAIQLDPNFGRAYAGLAVIYANRGERSEAEKYYRMAMQRIDRMTPRERYRTRGGYYLMMHNYPKAIEEYSTLVKQFPFDSAGAYNLALALFQGRDMSRALQHVRQVALRNPSNIFYQSNAASFAVYAGDFEGAARQAQAVLKVNSAYAFAFVPLALAQLAQGQIAEAAETYRRLSRISAYGASVASHGLADLALYEGRLTEATRILETGIAGDAATNNTGAAAMKLVLLAQVRLLRGDKTAAREAADRALKGTKDDGVLMNAARLYVQSGLEKEARSLSAQFSARLEPDPQAYAKLIAGELSLKRGDAAAAVKEFQGAQRLSDTWLGHFDLGRAYLETGAFPEAHSEFDTCFNRRGEATAVFLDDTPSYGCFPWLHYYLGRAQEGLKSAGAVESYRTFIKIKEVAGEDPLLADARRRLASVLAQR